VEVRAPANRMLVPARLHKEGDMSGQGTSKADCTRSTEFVRHGHHCPALLVIVVALVSGCGGGRWVRDYAGYLPGAHGDDIGATLVVSARTGKPLAGAKVLLYREEIRQDEVPAPFVAEFETDAFGVFWTRLDPKSDAYHWVYDASGYAAVDSYAEAPEHVELRPGEVVRGRLLDSMGRPCPHVLVEHFVGCVHSPAVRSATTNGDGWYVLRDVDPGHGSLWAPAAGTAADYVPARLAPVPGFVNEPMRQEPGVVVAGRVLDDRGRPVSGALVYSTRLERGPKVRTASDGSFRLVGIAPDAEIRCAKPGVELESTRTEPPPQEAIDAGPKARIRIRPPGDAGEYEFWIDFDTRFHARPDGSIEVATTRKGPVLLSFEHRRWGRGEIVVDVCKPLVEVGPEDFPVPHSITVVGPDGSLLPDRDTAMETGPHGWAVAGAPVEVWTRRGGWEEVPRVSWRLRSGALIRVRREGSMPMLRTLGGSKAQVVSWGRAALEFDVSPPGFVCLVDGELWRGNRRLRIAGLDPGPHTVILGAKGSVGRAMRVHLGKGETRRIRGALRRR